MFFVIHLLRRTNFSRTTRLTLVKNKKIEAVEPEHGLRSSNTINQNKDDFIFLSKIYLQQKNDPKYM